MYTLSRAVGSIIVNILGFAGGKYDFTIEMCLWGEEKQEGRGCDEPRAFLLLPTAKNGLVCAEASLALTKEVDVPSLRCRRS